MKRCRVISERVGIDCEVSASSAWEAEIRSGFAGKCAKAQYEARQAGDLIIVEVK